MASVAAANDKAPEHAQVGDRMARRQFAPDPERRGHRKGDCQEHDVTGIERILFLAFVQHDLERCHPDDQRGQSPGIHVALGAANVVRIVQKRLEHQDGDHSHRQVDVEDPAPREVVSQPTAHHRSQDGRHNHAQRPDGHGAAVLPGRKRLQQHRLRQRLQRPAAGSLNDPEGDQQTHGGSDSAKQRGRGKTRGGDQQQVLAPDAVGQPAGNGNHDPVRHQIGSQNPGGLAGCGGEAAGNVRQGNVDDRRIQHLHKGGEHDRHGDEPRILAQTGGRAERSLRRDRLGNGFGGHGTFLSTGIPRLWQSACPNREVQTK